MNFKLALVAAMLVTSVQASAKDKAVGSGPNPYSDCGIGAALFTENKTLAVTSNVIWDIGTTAVTSATASPETCNGKKVAVATFILESHDRLTEDTARGNGTHLTALLDLMEVAASERPQVIAALRAEMADNIAQPTYVSADRIGKATVFFNAAVNAQNAA